MYARGSRGKRTQFQRGKRTVEGRKKFRARGEKNDLIYIMGTQ